MAQITFRPLWARRVLFPLVVLVGGAAVAGALTLPANWRVSDRLMLLGFAALVAAFLLRLAAVRVEADDSGVTVVNLRGRRRLAWAQIVDLRLGRGDAWLTLDLSDGSTLPAMGVQGSDGDHARDQARQLGRLVAQHSRTARND